jgi:hypothetical protein
LLGINTPHVSLGASESALCRGESRVHGVVRRRGSFVTCKVSSSCTCVCVMYTGSVNVRVCYVQV